MEQAHAGADGLTQRVCPECGDTRGFEQPPCVDGHGMDCPERACVDCGTALFVDPRQIVARPERTSARAPRRFAGQPIRHRSRHVA
ncbi:hypothetical protein [Frankia sp. Cj5]|uniref:hypothetical protein n=1 Tax=Frankia sp. Cj5 TaxID=2880978 RepID=UPI001EF60BFA|nr:hypothetical protein [Frankia sp. Cj5]